ncbi:MAG: proline--tRNA ligase [Candidatus Diapherotrites archaeon]|nr:proline--tRNA ligase [Candidatus Diapherotrites archaeon]
MSEKVDGKKESQGLSVKKSDDFSEWYTQVVLKAELVDYGPVKGFMVIRPKGYHIWQTLQNYFNSRLSLLGVKNAYFPLLIPESFFKKEAQHAEGFAPELAWIEQTDKTEERVAIRPTSETIMYDSYAKWIRSYRDLPLKINQWCNVLRWEVKQTKLFLRTREFLWQEGHCVFETEEQTDENVLQILVEYQKMIEEILAIHPIAGRKTKSETFAGAKWTASLEAFMPDGKILQLATSHNLGQGFAKAFGLKFEGQDQKIHIPWQTSWGFSTRLIGALVMVHSDDKGLILPPKIAEHKIAIVPILFEKTKKEVLEKCNALLKELHEFDPLIDVREDVSPGYKFNEFELQGIPLRLELGPKDLEKNQVVLVRRDSGEKTFVKISELKKEIEKQLQEMHSSLLKKSKEATEKAIIDVKNFDEFKKALEQKKYIRAFFCETPECEKEISEPTTAKSSCIPFGQKESKEKCFKCGKPATRQTLFAKSY